MQKSMLFTPLLPSAGPTGGDGDAWPAPTISLTITSFCCKTFFDIFFCRWSLKIRRSLEEVSERLGSMFGSVNLISAPATNLRCSNSLHIAAIPAPTYPPELTTFFSVYYLLATTSEAYCHLQRFAAASRACCYLPNLPSPLDL